MIYYELAKLIEDSRDTPINNLLIEKLNEKISYEGNAKTRLANHVVDLVSYRINQVFNEFIIGCNFNKKEDINLGLIKLKKEIIYCYTLARTNILMSVSDNLVKSLDDFIDNAISELKITFINSNDSELIMMINSINLKEGL